MLIDEIASGNMRVYKDGQYIEPMKLSEHASSRVMGGFFGAYQKRDIVLDVFFGTDYHSHLGTRNAGMANLDRETAASGRSLPSPTRRSGPNLKNDLPDFRGNCGVGCISDSDPSRCWCARIWPLRITTVGSSTTPSSSWTPISPTTGTSSWR
jgi:hypothetical protein